MKRETIDSDSVRSIGYQPENQLLEIEFSGGGVYQYEGVDQWEHLELISAESVGTYVNQELKRKGHPYRKVT